MLTSRCVLQGADTLASECVAQKVGNDSFHRRDDGCGTFAIDAIGRAKGIGEVIEIF
jgi:hypothetical protein